MGKCCEVLIMPRGGEIGPIGIAGEPGIQGIQGIQGINGVNGQISVNQTRKFVQDFSVPPGNTFTLTVLQSNLVLSGISQLTGQAIKVRSLYRDANNTWRDMRLAVPLLLNSILWDFGNLNINITSFTGVNLFRIIVSG